MTLRNARNLAYDFNVKLSECMCSPSWRNCCNLLAFVIPSSRACLCIMRFGLLCSLHLTVDSDKSCVLCAMTSYDIFSKAKTLLKPPVNGKMDVHVGYSYITHH